jgi:hypothetical protein
MLQSTPQHFVLWTPMPFKPIRLAFCAGFTLLAPPLFAHHSFSAEFDAKQRTTFEGVVTKIEWTNPHVYFYADVKDKKGQVENWAFETAGPNMLARAGWDRNLLKVGDHVTVVAYPARDGARVASARSVLLANGRKVLANSPLDGGPQP